VKHRVPAAAAIALAASFLLAGCGAPAPTQGYVYAENYNPPSSYYVPGYYVSGSCSRSRYNTYCSPGYEVPGYVQYVAAEWQLQLCKKRGAPSKTNMCGWRDVDEQTYHSVHLGQFYATTAGH
jgi:hypothetical protein